MKKRKVTIIIPVHNGSSTLEQMLHSLINQDVNNSFQVTNALIINDGSKDTSQRIINSYANKIQSKFKCKFDLFTNSSPKGLAHSYNKVSYVPSDFVVSLHQDVILRPNALIEIIRPLLDDNAVVATKHISYLPRDLWLQYNFWQKAFFDRFVEKELPSHDGKFNAYRTMALRKINYWDEDTFKTAGEDGDMLRKLSIIGTFLETKAIITHIHTLNPNFSWKDIVKKHSQYAEANGALLRRYGIEIPIFFIIFFREILTISIIIPLTSIFGIIAGLIYSYKYTSKSFYYGTWDQRFALYLLNFCLLFISTFSTMKGLISGKQQ